MYHVQLLLVPTHLIRQKASIDSPRSLPVHSHRTGPEPSGREAT